MITAKDYNAPRDFFPTTPLLQAIVTLGPKRIQWGGRPANAGMTIKGQATCWLLDGKPATMDAIIHAARLRGIYERAARD